MKALTKDKNSFYFLNYQRSAELLKNKFPITYKRIKKSYNRNSVNGFIFRSDKKNKFETRLETYNNKMI